MIVRKKRFWAGVGLVSAFAGLMALQGWFYHFRWQQESANLNGKLQNALNWISYEALQVQVNTWVQHYETATTDSPAPIIRPQKDSEQLEFRHLEIRLDTQITQDSLRISRQESSVNISVSANAQVHRIGDISKLNLDSLIGVAWKNQGMETDIVYALYINDSLKYGQNLQADSLQYVEVSFIEPGEKHREAMLRASMPGRNLYLFRLLLPQALPGLVFFALLAGVSVYIMRLLRKQEKLIQLKNDFLNNLTHEWKTPLSTISLAARTLESERFISSPHELRKISSIILQENKKMEAGMEAMLDLARLESGNFPVRLTSIPLKAWLEEIRQALPEAQARSLVLDIPEDVFLQVDTFLFERVVWNILDNAYKYRKDDQPEFLIRYKREDEHHRLSFEDNGMGISKEDLPFVFDKFYRAESGNIQNTKGYGLGLAWVKQAIHWHKGEVTIASESGKGTYIYLKLPA